MKRFLIALCLIFAFPAWAGVIEGYDPDGQRKPYRNDVDGRMIGWNLVIDSCEAVTGWTALSNDTTGIAVDLDHVMGAKSLEFDKVDGAANTIFGGIQKTLTAIDLTTIVENGGSFTVSSNISALTDIAYCFLRLGTDVSNYNEWRVDDSDLSIGWTSLRYNTDAPTSAGSLGNGWNPAIVTYVAIGCAFDAETDALADIRVDHITARGGQQVAADINASASSSSSATKVNLVKVGGNDVTTTDADTGAGVDDLQQVVSMVPGAGGAVQPSVGAGNVDTGTPKVTVATDDVNLAAINADTTTIAADTTSLDLKVTVADGDSGAGTDNVQRVVSVVPGAGGAVLPDVGTGNVGTGTPRMTVATDDANIAKLSAWDDGADRANVNVEHDWEIDSMDVTTGWAVANDASANLATNANHVEGVGSLEFDKVDGTNFTEGYIEKTVTSMDLNDYEAHNVVEWAIYLSSLTDVEYAFVRLGTDLNNYSEWRVDDEDLTAGRWNPIAMFAGDVEHAVVGTGLITTALTYVAVGVSFSNESDALAGIVIDHIQVHESAHTTASIAAEVKTSVTTANVNLAKVKNQITDTGIGAAGVGTQRVSVATDDVVSISDDNAANTATNPVYVQPTDGTAVNAVGNPIYAAVSKDTNANATANRIFVAGNLDQVSGNAVAVDAGNSSTGTQRVVNATDDPNLAKLTAWDDGNDRANVNVEGHWLIDTMDVTTNWATANDASANLATNSNHVEGVGSLEFDKVDGTGFTEGYIEKTISSVDLAAYEAHSLIEWVVYLSALTNVEYTFLRLGTDLNNYSEWRVLVGDLTAAQWNPIAMFAGDVEHAVVGTGLISSAVTYVAVGVSFNAENNTLAGIVVDAIHVHESNHATATISAAVTSSVTSANINVQKVGGGPTTTGAGNVGVNGTQRVTIATNDVNLAAINASVAIVDDWDATEDSAASADGAQVMFEARTAQKAAVDNGDAVRPTTNDHGETITAGYTWATDSNRMEEIDPLDQKYVRTPVANVTDGADAGGTTCPAGTDYCYFISMDGFKNSGMQLIMGCDAGTVTATVECSWQSGAPATLDYEIVTNSVFGVASLVAAAGPATDGWVDNAGKLNTCTYVMIRINANTTANTGDWQIDYTQTAM